MRARHVRELSRAGSGEGPSTSPKAPPTRPLWLRAQRHSFAFASLAANGSPQLTRHKRLRIDSGEHAMITQSKPEFSTTPHDILRILFRHKKKVVACFFITMAVT